MQRYVIVGGGLAGHKAAVELRRLAPGASVALIGDEDIPPYDRPSLSKDVLMGLKPDDAIHLSDAHFYAEGGIDHSWAARVAAIDPAARRVETDDGRRFGYDRLLIATGSRPRPLPLAVPASVEIRYLRTLVDAAALRRRLAAGRHVAVIGGGFIGLEVAAAARSRGCRVTVVEAAERLLARGMPRPISDWVHRLHESEGVDIRLTAQAENIEERDGTAIMSGAGLDIRADLIVVGIGIVPNVEIAAAAGLRVDDGLVVDESCRTSDPFIFGAGEVTSHPVWCGGRRRIESWKYSGEQAVVAARSMAGEAAHFSDIPWLWSDQYESNIQSIGFPDLATRHEVLGDAGSRSWTWVGLDDDDTVVGAVAINRGRDISMLRRVIRNKAGLSAVRTKVPA